MNERDDGRHARPHGEDREEWWATLTADALEDETETNRRAERWLLVAAPLSFGAAALIGWWHGGPA